MTRPVDLYSPCAGSASPLLAPLRAQPGRRRATPLSLCGAWPTAPHNQSRRTRAVHSWAAPVHYGALLEQPDESEREESPRKERIIQRGEKALSQCEIRRESIFEKAARRLGERTQSVDGREFGDLAHQIGKEEGEIGDVEGEIVSVVGEGDSKALLGRTRKTGNIEKSQAPGNSLFSMPGIKSLVSRRRDIPSSPLVRRDSSSLVRLSSERLNSPVTPGGPATGSASGSGGSTSSLSAAGLRKCETVLALTGLGAVLRSTASTGTVTHHGQALQAVNRLRVTPATSSSRLCSRCSSLLSLAAASGSRYSLNHATGFVPICDEPLLLCKLCLIEVPSGETVEIQQCQCSFCKECMKAYVEFEIAEGAYDISCPDAQCPSQGVLNICEVERLVGPKLVEKHRKYRLNREIDLDASRTWCPRAGCETVCKLCPSERCSPQSVHCPTCTADFCSNCKLTWHGGLSCDEYAKQLAKEGKAEEPGIPFDSDLIKCCPMCNVPIEKDEGCAQMMCKRCKHVFCWYCLTSLDDDFLLRHYDKGPCKNKLGHSRASVIWHRTQVIGIFAGFGILLLVASPLLLLAAPCIVCCKCRVCNAGPKLENEDDLQDDPEQTS